MTNTEQLPSTEDNEKDLRSLKELRITQDEYEMLSVANPESDEVKDILSSYGISSGEDVMVHIDSGDGESRSVVVTTDSEDFFTTDRKLTNEIGESLSGSTVEDIKKDFENNAEMLAAGKFEYDRQIDGALEAVRDDAATVLNRFEQSIEESNTVLNTASAVAEDAALFIKTLTNKIEYEGYTPADVRKLIENQQLTTGLNRARNSVMASANEIQITKDSVEPLHQTNSEVSELLTSREHQFKSFLDQLEDDSNRPEESEYSVDRKRNDIKGIDQGIDELSAAFSPIVEMTDEYASEIIQVINHIDLITETAARHGVIDVSELMGVANKLQAISESVNARRVIPGMMESVGDIRQKIRRLG